MDCEQINDPELLVYYFRQDDGPALTRALNCFYEQFFDYVSKFLYKTVFATRPATKNKEEDLLKTSFNDALQAFYFFVRNTGFQNQKASVRTLFTTFCRNKLLGLTKELARMSEKYTDKDPSILLEGNLAAATEPLLSVKEYDEIKDRMLERYKTAFSRLDERCVNLLVWRKVHRLSNEEIAGRMKTIDPNSVNNEVYKCFLRLKKHLDSLKNED